MRSCLKHSRHGFTLVEMMMTLGCAALLFAAILTAGVALQRSFAAVEGYSTSEGDQLRVQDYIGMDCRRAVSALVDTGSWTQTGGLWGWTSNSTGTKTLILTVPDYYDSNGHPQAPNYTSTYSIQYGAGGTTTISYYQSGTSFLRQVGTNPSAATAIATNVSSFTVSSQDLTSTVSCSITFSPSFTNLAGPGPIAGTTIYSNTFLRNAVARQ